MLKCIQDTDGAIQHYGKDNILALRGKSNINDMHSFQKWSMKSGSSKNFEASDGDKLSAKYTCPIYEPLSLSETKTLLGKINVR